MTDELYPQNINPELLRSIDQLDQVQYAQSRADLLQQIETWRLNECRDLQEDGIATNPSAIYTLTYSTVVKRSEELPLDSDGYHDIVLQLQNTDLGSNFGYEVDFERIDTRPAIIEILSQGGFNLASPFSFASAAEAFTFLHNADAHIRHVLGYVTVEPVDGSGIEVTEGFIVDVPDEEHEENSPGEGFTVADIRAKLDLEMGVDPDMNTFYDGAEYGDFAMPQAQIDYPLSWKEALEMFAPDDREDQPATN